VLTPFVATPICNHAFDPVNAFVPKLIGVVNNPLLTMTPLLVIGPNMAVPFAFVA
jgi:hypothetical protein